MRLSYHELYDMIPSVFWNAVDGFWLQKENEERLAWIRTRWSTCCLLNIHLPKHKQLRPSSLIKFDWEKASGKQNNEELKSYEDTLFEYEKLLKKRNAKK